MERPEIYPSTNYSFGWLLLGILLLACILGVNFYIIWATRKKKPKMMESLQPKLPVVPDSNFLKQKYSALLDEVERNYNSGVSNNREAHLQTSMLMRLFVYELKGNLAQTMTLTELRQTPWETLVAVIEAYYPTQFSNDQQREFTVSIQAAREMIRIWN